MEKKGSQRYGTLLQHPLLLLLALAIGFVIMDPFKMGPLGHHDFKPVKHDLAPFKQVMENWPRDNKSRLGSGNLEFVDEVFGPESLEFDSLGRGPYAGLADGRVVRWMGEDVGWETFALVSTNWSEKLCARGVDSTTSKQWKHEKLCGRPLGLRFHKESGNLYIADAYYGLLVVGPEGGLATPLATHQNDTTEDHFFILLEGESTGRLLRYDPPTKTTHIVLDGLAFPNGVQLSKDQTFLVFTETTNCRIMKYWLEGPSTGRVELVANLPGFPDNNPWMKSVYFRLPIRMKYLARLVGMKMYTVVSLFDENGEILDVLEDTKGVVMKLVSEVREVDGKLWIGTVAHNHIATLSYP
ncbi:hypothetical protein OIU84_029228 [Salix udensis]|uniref:Strictosidine synthase conserved region domain-containing protein n=1 Tax=Salix udensis TaxID=889485 RepID=A0AAD6P7P1_9ROSI|nr:hypothetical protein OIU84_029228 [Salix udensis]